MSGHWFCNHCNDVVFMPPPGFDRPGWQPGLAKCHVCHHWAAEWVPSEARRVRGEGRVEPARAAELFQGMRESIL